ncbi:fused MFS/spermidine synthase [Conexibacter stalactiti]|uniref:Fused MFS/spermidine synthase n=1 Tax=Conexibacter stalactiti TaxID=1940611 RepID=A0ABU4HU87_9ACTN|nr:fused MFS/spermidine synthase [Conexibacter stalactiti]MDW5596871.1 fused MFS/spermidine synthase [Conexibacter stalactiti]MEC5037513.1 fused MFS/spermidine synthase [Conexibacter stalactiti]
MAAESRPTGARAQAANAIVPLPSALPPLVAAALVFLAAGAVLVLEILAVRLLAPYVGLTLETTTSIIGAALAGIAAGAAVGGWLADRTDTRRLVVGLLIVGGLLALLTVPLVRWLGPGARGGGDLAALGITLVALVPPAAVLSAVSPAVARIQLHDLRASGTTVGRLSAWATAGALVGTFGSGFVLVPLMPVSTAVFATGALLVVAGLALGLRFRALRPAAALAAVAAAVAFGTLSVTGDSPCDAETDYHCARIALDGARPSTRELLLDDVRHSFVDLDDPTHLEFPYTQWIADAIDTSGRDGDPLDVVFIGGGGFTLPRWLLATRPGSRAHVLEVDGDLVEVARERLGLRTSPSLRVTVGDARISLLDVPGRSADVVVGDAFGTLAVPWHLATAEWADEIRRVLKPGGLYVLNVIDQRPLELLRAEAATLRDRFAHVRLIAVPGRGGDPAGGNGVLLASDRPLPPAAGSTADGARTWDEREVARFAAGAQVLRDDDAPVDQLLTS